MNNHQNLKQWRKGESGNPNGRPIGSKNWSSIVKELLESDELINDLITKKLFHPNIKSYKSTTSQAIGIVMVLKALEGDIRAAEWLRKTAYGDKIELSETTTPPIALVEFVNSYPHSRSFRTEDENEALLAKEVDKVQT